MHCKVGPKIYNFCLRMVYFTYKLNVKLILLNYLKIDFKQKLGNNTYASNFERRGLLILYFGCLCFVTNKL